MTSMSAFEGIPSTAPLPPAGGPSRVFAVCAADRAHEWGGAWGRRVDRVIDPMRVECGPFIAQLNRLQRAAFESDGMAVPQWALYDCAEVTGLVAGLLDERSGEAVSMVAATPMLEPDAWHVFALGARDGSFLGRTLQLIPALLRPSALTGVVAWRGGAWPAWGALGRPEILTAWTPAHTNPASATVRIGGASVRASGAADAGGGDEIILLDPADHAAMQRIQSGLDGGARVFLDGAPGDDGRMRLRMVPA
jgi:hypothetical protein